MNIPLFSSGRTIQKLKQKIQSYCEGEGAADFSKIDVILNATNTQTKDGIGKACLQILFRCFHKGRWVDPEFSARRLKAVLFLRATLNELEQEDLRDLLLVRQSLGDVVVVGNDGCGFGPAGQQQYQQQQQQQQQQYQQQQQQPQQPQPEQRQASQYYNELSQQAATSIYLAHAAPVDAL
ncbi:hypothetical protein BGZ94_006449, partial [Podila epigama]